MKARNERTRQWERYWRRERAAGRGPGTGFGPNGPHWADIRGLREHAHEALKRDQSTWDDLDRYIIETWGPDRL